MSESDDDEDLPFPTPLPRSAFLAPDFSPQEYLSSLRNRHQTLEDLRSDLRSRVQDLSKELFDLVNNEYEDFLSVGSTLKGGDDKIEQVRVGVLGFRREVEGIRDAVIARGEEVERLLEQRREVRRNIALGRQLLEIESRLEELEGRLIVEPGQGDGDDHEDDEDDLSDGDGTVASMQISKLRAHAQLYLQLKQAIEYVIDHPFLDTQKPRMMRIRNTLFLDLNTALKQAKATGAAGSSNLMLIMGLYRELGEGGEAVRILKGG